jgi:hypothetical protein
MSFADVAKLGTKEQEAVIEQVSDDDADRLEKFMRSTQLQVANQRKDTELEGAEVANQEADKAALRTQEVIDDVIGKIPQIITLYENDLQQGKKLSMKDKIMLERVLAR